MEWHARLLQTGECGSSCLMADLADRADQADQANHCRRTCAYEVAGRPTNYLVCCLHCTGINDQGLPYPIWLQAMSTPMQGVWVSVGPVR